MNTLPILIALALAPGVYLSIAVYGKDKYEPEPKRILLAAFLLGCLCTLPAAIFEVVGLKLLGFGGLKKLGIRDAVIQAFLVVALTEEGLKFLVLRFHAYRKKDFNEPFDGIVYGSFVALGFATFENLLYVLHRGFAAGVFRMFTAVPGHYAYGVIMGYYVGKAKFEAHNQTAHMLRGLFSAIVLHGAYDTFLLQGRYPVLGLFTLVILVLALGIAHRETKELQTDSVFCSKTKPPLIPAPPVAKS